MGVLAYNGHRLNPEMTLLSPLHLHLDQPRCSRAYIIYVCLCVDQDWLGELAGLEADLYHRTHSAESYRVILVTLPHTYDYRLSFPSTPCAFALCAPPRKWLCVGRGVALRGDYRDLYPTVESLWRLATGWHWLQNDHESDSAIGDDVTGPTAARALWRALGKVTGISCQGSGAQQKQWSHQVFGRVLCAGVCRSAGNVGALQRRSGGGIPAVPKN